MRMASANMPVERVVISQIRMKQMQGNNQPD